MNPRYTFFSGKGGVGKTTMACATAMRLAGEGLRTLIVTTDPASNLADVFEQEIGHAIVPVTSVPNLFAMEIDGDQATEAYKDRALAPVGATFPSEVVRVMEEQMSGPCTSEVAAFDCFTDFIAGDDRMDRPFDALVFDTAPTGHTLRLLELPVEWSKQLDIKVFSTVEGTAADDVAKRRFAEVIDLMRDPMRSTFAFVMYPEATPVVEAHRGALELSRLGIPTGLVVANQVLGETAEATPFGRSRRAMQQKYLDEIRAGFQLPVMEIPLFPTEVRGLEVLATLGDQILGPAIPADVANLAMDSPQARGREA
jgi:arsenite-transporting ATPase